MSVNRMERAREALERYWASCGSPATVTQAMAGEVQHPLFVAGRTSAEIEADFKTVGRPSLTGLARTLERLTPKPTIGRLASGVVPGVSQWNIL